jgi:hypothetical protein
MDPAPRIPSGTASGDRRPPSDEEPEGFAWKGALALGLVVAGLVVWRACSKPEGPVSDPLTPPAGGDLDLAANAERAPDEGAAPSAGRGPAAPPRCAQLAPEPFVIGDAPREQRNAAGAGGGDGESADELAPFAVEVGRGTTYAGGFAVGAQREAEGGTLAMVATLAADGTQGKLVRLARSRGDMDPPVVAGAGGAILAAMLEPNAGGRALKIARVEGDHVTWGAELSEGRDESLALDIAASGERAVIVWDDVTRDGKRSQVMLSSVDTGSLRSVTSPRPISHPKTDAEMPRVIARPGGYWLAYVARAEEPGQKRGAKEDDEEDTAAAGETIAHQWLEVAPLDETGAPTATPRAVTPKNGHVLAYDMTLGQDDGAIVAFRDDDTPSGSSGGRVSAVLVRLGGVGEPRAVAGVDRGERDPSAPPDADHGLGAGVPALLRGTADHGAGEARAVSPAWLAIANASGATQIAALDPKGELVDDLRAEPTLGRGEPIAALADALLVAHPAGKAMTLAVLRCATAPALPK